MDDFYAALVRGSASIGDLGLQSAEECMFGPVGDSDALGAQCLGEDDASSPGGAQVEPSAQSQPVELPNGSTQRPASDSADNTSSAASGERVAAASRPAKRHPRNERNTYRVMLRYLGSAFDGWMWQPGKYTVEAALQEALGPLCVEGKAVLACSGRTDKGVSAACQVNMAGGWW